MPVSGHENLRVRVIRSLQWSIFLEATTPYRTSRAKKRTSENQAELGLKNYESGGQEVESRRARHQPFDANPFFEVPRMGRAAGLETV